jgi:hypothetical protein
MTTWLATAGIVISGVALGISGISALFARRQLQLAERSRGRDFEATVVAELVGARQDEDAVRYEIRVTNAGPSVARDVDVSLIEWGDTSLGKVLAQADVAPALLRGERRAVSLELANATKTRDRDVSVELHADYYDDNGVRNERLALVVDDTFVLTPPQPRLRV